MADGSERAAEAVIEIPADEIVIGERLRPVTPERVAIMKGYLQAEGQKNPVQVCRLPGMQKYTVVTGAHRVKALQEMGERALAIVVGNSREERETREIVENLHRTDMTPLERAEFLGTYAERRRDEFLGGRTQQELAVRARWERDKQKASKEEADDTAAIMAGVFGWTDEVVQKAGLSARTLRRDMMLFKGIPPHVRRGLQGVEGADNQSLLLKFAGLPLIVQERLLRQCQKGDFAGLKEALKSLEPAKPQMTAQDRLFVEALDRVSRMSSAVRVGFFDRLAGQFNQDMRAALSRPGSLFSDEVAKR
jgi:hypothetical protein